MSARNGGNRESSLIPYLSCGSNPPLIGLSLVRAGSSPADRSLPFEILHDSDPLTRLIAASFVTDTGSELKRVFLLLQKDRYHLERDEIRPLNNTDIDSAWQETSARRKEGGHDPCYIDLAAQAGEGADMVQFSPIFYCRSANVFFHPPCPRCGNRLELCRDDELLASSSLHPYTTSLKRYLYCPVCTVSGHGVFYTREIASDDPGTLRDLQALIDDFGGMGETPGGKDALPCFACAERGACLAASGSFRSMIVPFSFYPFHMMIFEAMTLPAVDFLQLLSGRSMDDLKNALAGRNERGRTGCLGRMEREGTAGNHLFPADDGRRFLEVLYLKLSFLADILGRICSGPGFEWSWGHNLTIDHIWVQIPPKSGLLPSFWDFGTNILGLAGPADLQPLFPGPAATNLRVRSGILWFYTLLANSRQSGREIVQALKDSVSASGAASSATKPSGPIFAPGQIFWEPQGNKVEEGVVRFWERALDLGFELLKSAVHPDPLWSTGEFFASLEVLRAEVKAAMFSGAPAVTVSAVRTEEKVIDKGAIHGILAGIAEKWSVTGIDVETSKEPVEESDATATVILAPPPTPPPAPAGDEEEWTETIILSARDIQKDALPPARQDREGDGLLETVVISPRREAEEPQPPPMENEGVILEETVILAPGGWRESAPAQTPGSENELDEGDDAAPSKADELPETVMINPKKPKMKPKEWKD